MTNKRQDSEQLVIYQKYMDLIYYTELITEKFPKVSKMDLVPSIKNTTYEGMKCIIKAYKLYDKKDKLYYLNELDINLKYLKVLIRVSNHKKYINLRNYEAWSRKLNSIGIYLGGWINSCLKA